MCDDAEFESHKDVAGHIMDLILDIKFTVSDLFMSDGCNCLYCL